MSSSSCACPRLSWLLPNILDRYIAAMYLRAAALSFAALLGIFYIATFIDLSDKLFKGQATTVTLLHLLVLKTPQFVYFVIPMAALLSVLATFGLLSRTNELSVMKACGISLYRITVPLILLGFAWSTVLYGLEQQIMARANQHGEELESQIRGRPPRTANPLNRQWLIARDGAIYHYTYFDPRPKAIRNLVVYRPGARPLGTREPGLRPQRRVLRTANGSECTDGCRTSPRRATAGRHSRSARLRSNRRITSKPSSRSPT